MRSSPRLPFLLLIAIIVQASGRPVTAQEKDAEWLAAPPLVKEVTATDRAARDAVVRLIAEQQKKESVDLWDLEVPERASGLPANYDLIFHRGSGCWTREEARLDIRIRGDEAQIELVDLEGIHRAIQPAKELDGLARQLAYAFHAKLRPGNTKSYGFSFSIGPASIDIEIVSRDERAPFHLQPEHLRPYENAGGKPTENIRGLVYQHVLAKAFPLAEREGKRLEPKAEADEILRRLKELPQLNEAAAKKYSDLQRHQCSIEREVFGELAVKRGLAAAMPELKRLSLSENQRQLAITSNADPKPLIQQAVVGADAQQAHWAETFALDDQHPERLQWLIEVLPKLKKDKPDSTRGEWIGFQLGRRQLSPQQIEQLAAQFETTKHVRMKLGLAQALLPHTHEKKYFEHLVSLVRTLPPPKDPHSRDPRRTAADFVFRYVIETGKYRDEAYALLKKLLEEPREMDAPDAFEIRDLVETLGQLGSAKNLPYLKKLAERDSVYLSSTAIAAMINIAPPAGLIELHRRLDKLTASKVNQHDYSHLIYSNFELMIFERDVEVIPYLKKAWADLNKKPPPQPAKKQSADVWEFESVELPERVSEGYNPRYVIAFLEAKDGPSRAEAAIAHFGDRAYLHDRRKMQRLVDQLIAEGADPNRCQLLLAEEPRKRGG